MDIACNFGHPNVLRGREGSSYKNSDGFDSNVRYRPRGLSFNFIAHRKLVLKTCPSKKMKKLIPYGGRGFQNCVGGLNLNKSSNGDFNNVFKKLRIMPLQCQNNDSLAYVDGNGRDVDFLESTHEETPVIESSHDEIHHGETSCTEVSQGDKLDQKQIDCDMLGEEVDGPRLEELRELLQKAVKELEIARLNSTKFEEKAQSISETAIALKDEAASAGENVTSALSTIEQISNEESVAKEAVQKATMALSLAEARLQVAIESLEAAKESDAAESSRVRNFDSASPGQALTSASSGEEALSAAQDGIRDCKATLASFEEEFGRIQNRKEELQKEVDILNDVAEKTRMNALRAEEEVANIMFLAEQAVAFELEAAQHVCDAEIALQRAEKCIASAYIDTAESTITQSGDVLVEEKLSQANIGDVIIERDRALPHQNSSLLGGALEDSLSVITSQGNVVDPLDDQDDRENGNALLDSSKEADQEAEKLRNVVQTKKQEVQKDLTRDGSLPITPKALLSKSSRFFSASFFSFTVDGTEFTPASVFHGVMEFVKKQWPKLVFGLLLAGAGVSFYANRAERNPQMLQQPDVMAASIEEVSANANTLVRQIRKVPRRIKKLIEKLPHQEINEEEASLFDMLWLLLASVIFVPVFQKIPGGSPVLGYLAAGILIGPYGLSIIRNVHATKAIAEFGVVFLLFNIGLELSVERLSSMKKYVFGLGSAQVLATAVAVGLVAHYVAGLAGPASIVIGNGLALSSTAVVLQVLQERGESTSRHGRATFSVLLFQDLAVVVLLILIPLISPNSSKGGVGFQAIVEALGLAAVKAVAAIAAIIAGGRLLLRPIYRKIAENQNAEIFSANTLLVILGTSLLTARAGLSMALGAFLAGLLLAETEFSLQVESDIAPYRGLLLGLFFMTVGMSIDPKLLLSNFPVISGTLGLLIVGKALLVAFVGKLCGISIISAIRIGLLLAPGGEFAFVAFGEAVNQGIMSTQLSSLLFLVVGISMAFTPWLAEGGQLIASRFELHDVRSLLPVESETDDLQDHIIICGFGRVGQIIAQLLSERLIPFVALDVRSDRVAVGRALDLPVYFGDAGSREVLHKVGAERACAAAITLDTPGANYRAVWALNKYFPNVKTFVRAHDVDHGLNLEKAGATAVVPETLEPSLQLAAAVLAQAKLPTSEIAATINEFRSRHLSELTELCEASGSSLGYGFSRVMTMSRSKTHPLDSSDEDQIPEGTLAI
ncbi:Regulator of K+ conductance, N-terminal [Dillenia turbinata]|uniref:Regulator of K+ conductance, N-terminal n=1 Tax=Dillenia turbinata TaxID=194707 RepID=A0AAN8UQ44_9MAGN